MAGFVQVGTYFSAFFDSYLCNGLSGKQIVVGILCWFYRLVQELLGKNSSLLG